METQSLAYLPKTRTNNPTLLADIDAAELTRSVVRWIGAATVAALVAIASIWAATNPAVDHFLGAALWGAGFVFLAIAVEVDIKRIFPYIITGVALPVLAVAGSYVAEEFSMLAGVIVAAWLAYWIARRSL